LRAGIRGATDAASGAPGVAERVRCHTTIAFAGLIEREFGDFVAPPLVNR
jgi:hypothetical protein